MSRARRGGQRFGDRGAVLVEMVLIMPIFILLVFGAIEFSSAYNDLSVVSDAGRSGGRIGSTLAKTDFTSANPSNPVTNAVAGAVKVLPAVAPQEMWIYKSNDLGYPGANGVSTFSSCPNGTCIKYTWNSGTRAWTYGSGSWPASSQNPCGTNADQVGVYLKIRHDFVTGLFGATVQLSDSSVFRFEPTVDCG